MYEFSPANGYQIFKPKINQRPITKVKLKYKCMQQTEYQVIECEDEREARGLLYDMRRYLTDYTIIHVIERSKSFQLV